MTKCVIPTMDVMRVLISGKAFDIRGDASDEDVKQMLKAGLHAAHDVHVLRVNQNNKHFFIQPSAQHLWMLASLGAEINLPSAERTSQYAKLAGAGMGAMMVACRAQLTRVLRRCIVHAQLGQCHMLWFDYPRNMTESTYVHNHCMAAQSLDECVAVVNYREQTEDRDLQTSVVSGMAVAFTTAWFGAVHPLTLAAMAFTAGVMRFPSCSY